MKSEKLSPVIIILILAAAVAAIIAWYSSPKVFLKNVRASDVQCISVFDGNNGFSFKITDADEIKNIVGNIQSCKMKRKNLSVNYSGFTFSMHFYDLKGEVLESLIMNGANTIRKDPFFYSTGDDLCFDYIKQIEDEYKQN